MLDASMGGIATARIGVHTRVLMSENICQSCGACCSHSADWPRFGLETDSALALIPRAFIARNGMRCEGNRCSALDGIVGRHTTCRIYAVRPDVCRACEPGDDACNQARTAAGLEALDPSGGVTTPDAIS